VIAKGVDDAKRFVLQIRLGHRVIGFTSGTTWGFNVKDDSQTIGCGKCGFRRTTGMETNVIQAVAFAYLK